MLTFDNASRIIFELDSYGSGKTYSPENQELIDQATVVCHEEAPRKVLDAISFIEDDDTESIALRKHGNLEQVACYLGTNESETIKFMAGINNIPYMWESGLIDRNGQIPSILFDYWLASRQVEVKKAAIDTSIFLEIMVMGLKPERDISQTIANCNAYPRILALTYGATEDAKTKESVMARLLQLDEDVNYVDPQLEMQRRAAYAVGALVNEGDYEGA